MLSRRSFLSLNLSTSQALRPTFDADLHLLHRITYGPTPVETVRIATIGRSAFIEEQLNPNSIDDSEADRKLARFRVLNQPRRQLANIEGYRLELALQHGMVTRAVHSKRQLLERMVEFWTDHFNVPLSDEPFELADYHNTIRRHALGKFPQLLAATAKHPAMLVYLDNYVNYAEHPNENYARELLELHTMGVDGGYTEKDVREVARAFTGWTTGRKTATGFYFDRETHDTAVKTVLGRTLPAGRFIEDGFQVLSILAGHKATSRFISHKLCQKFVADNPTPALVNSTADQFLQSGGDIKTVLRFIFNSAEFNAATGQKLRRPLDHLIGSLRATQTSVHNEWTLDDMLSTLDQRPFNWHPPNGYPEVAAAWASTNSMLARWNVAQQLTHAASSDRENGWGMSANLFTLIERPSTVRELVNRTATRIFGAPLSIEQSAPFIAYASDQQGPNTPVTSHLFSRKLPSLFGLMLASPLYQWR